MRVGQRTFNDADQVRFASASGDRNPMHIDVLAARRTPAGEPVVHGMNLLLWALDSLAATTHNLRSLRRCHAQFYNFIHLAEVVHADFSQQDTTRAQLTISVDNVPRSKVTLEFGEAVQSSSPWMPASLEQIALSPVPLESSFESFWDRSGSIPFIMTDEDALALFPSATKWLGAEIVCAIAASTYLVGMVCPGLHSIYREIDIELDTEQGPQRSLAFKVTKTDARFQSVEHQISGGGIAGTVKTFVRNPPVRQASMESLAGLVDPNEFAGSVSLIVGGSRGLGELTAKIIAAGGGRTIITWKAGKHDAEQVAQEIQQMGGKCETLAYDSRKPSAPQLHSLAENPTHAYYFATPSIFKPNSQIFSNERLTEFLAVYVDGFWQLAQALRARRPQLSLFYPSSVAVEGRPRGMTEYTMAKAAGEILCADLNAFTPKLRVTMKRLPRLLTDQTASNTAAETVRPIDIMLPIVRDVQSS